MKQLWERKQISQLLRSKAQICNQVFQIALPPFVVKCSVCPNFYTSMARAFLERIPDTQYLSVNFSSTCIEWVTKRAEHEEETSDTTLRCVVRETKYLARLSPENHPVWTNEGYEELGKVTKKSLQWWMFFWTSTIRKEKRLPVRDGLGNLTKWDDPFCIVMHNSARTHGKITITTFW